MTRAKEMGHSNSVLKGYVQEGPDEDDDLNGGEEEEAEDGAAAAYALSPASAYAGSSLSSAASASLSAFQSSGCRCSALFASAVVHMLAFVRAWRSPASESCGQTASFAACCPILQPLLRGVSHAVSLVRTPWTVESNGQPVSASSSRTVLETLPQGLAACLGIPSQTSLSRGTVLSVANVCTVAVSNSRDKRMQGFRGGLALCLCSQSEQEFAFHRMDLRAPTYDLPQEILDRIRASMPLSAYIRAALVSKFWQQGTYSSRMLKICWELHPPEPWLFAISGHDHGTFAFDPKFCTWRKIKLPVMSRNLVQLLSANNGLLCAAGDHSLLVVNPLKCVSKELPRCNIDRFDPVVGLSVNMDTCNFKVVVVGSYEAEAWTEVYDSISNKWTTTCRLPPQRRLALACCLFCKGRFYCWTAGPPEALLIYNLATNVWSEISISLPSVYAYGRLVEYRNRILLVGLSQGTSTFKSISVWEFREPNTEMDEIARMPYGIFKDFCSKGKSRLIYYAVSSGDLLYFFAKGNPRLVACNLAKQPVQWMQLAPTDPYSMDLHEIYLFSFCLHARLIGSS